MRKRLKSRENDPKCRISPATIQLTVAGQAIVVGLHAPNPVELVLKNAPEAVQILVHNMVANLAKGPRNWCDRATSSLAPVRSDDLFYLIGHFRITFGLFFKTRPGVQPENEFNLHVNENIIWKDEHQDSL